VIPGSMMEPAGQVGGVVQLSSHSPFGDQSPPVVIVGTSWCLNVQEFFWCPAAVEALLVVHLWTSWCLNVMRKSSSGVRQPPRR
jgi:hypothetical protein